MTTFVSLLIGIACLFVFWFEAQKQRSDGVFGTLLGILITVLFFGAGISTRSGRGYLLTGGDCSGENLYLVGTTTNVVCLRPAKLNDLTAVVEPNGSPSYYEGVKMETNSGAVVAIKTKTGDMVLKPPFLLLHTAKLGGEASKSPEEASPRLNKILNSCVFPKISYDGRHYCFI